MQMKKYWYPTWVKSLISLQNAVMFSVSDFKSAISIFFPIATADIFLFKSDNSFSKSFIYKQETCIRKSETSLYIHCCDIWGNTYHSSIQNLVVLQKRAPWIITHKNRSFPSLILFRELKLLKLTNIILIKCYVLVYKAFIKILPMHIQCFFNRYTCYYNVRSSYKFIRIIYKTTLYFNSTMPTVVRIWNELPDTIKLSRSIQNFKFTIKSMLLS